MTELSVYLPGIVLALSAMMLALMSPGPNILAVIGTSMSVGRRSGAALALGHLAYAFAFSTRVVVAGYIRARRWIEGAFGAFFCYAGFRLVTDKT